MGFDVEALNNYIGVDQNKKVGRLETAAMLQKAMIAEDAIDDENKRTVK